MYELLSSKAENLLRNLLTTDNYDSIHNFISLYDAYENANTNLLNVFEKYSPPIRDNNHTCVGLSLELIRQLETLESEFPGTTSAMFMISCEESVEDVREYVSGDPMDLAEKEHVLVGIRMKLGDRPGLLLADPGYHVPRVITVMLDRAFPHTGWFTKNDDPNCVKEILYIYNVTNTNYVEWHERDMTQMGKHQTSLLYVAKPYLSGVQVTEKRNLVYNYKSLISRDQKGNMIGGIYFPVGRTNKDAEFTLFHDDGAGRLKTKYKFHMFMDPENIPVEASNLIEICNTKLKYETGKLKSIICRLAQIMANASFISQVIEIDEDVGQLNQSN